ncbi:MAG: hypothetical protein JW932_04820 [Deltaproteobacteria bacterium]|nr:hypothetical protein [Deltaproteobacteria bacterium]
MAPFNPDRWTAKDLFPGALKSVGSTASDLTKSIATLKIGKWTDDFIGYPCLMMESKRAEKTLPKGPRAIEHAKVDQRVIASISAWEFAMMIMRKKIRLTITPNQWLDYAMKKNGLKVMELSPRIAVEFYALPGNVQDEPANRIIAATAWVYEFSLLLKDKRIPVPPNIVFGQV